MKVLAELSGSGPDFAQPGAPAIAADGTLYLSADDDRLHALDPTGKELWATTDGRPYGTPAIGVDGTIYSSAINDMIYALDPANGKPRWTHPTDGPPSPPTLGPDGTVYVGANKGSVYALDGATGATRWTYTLGGPHSAATAGGRDGTVYAGSSSFGTPLIVALAAATGTLKWQFTGMGDPPKDAGLWPGVAVPTVGDNGLVYVASINATVYALDALTGDMRWSFAVPRGVSAGLSIGADGTVYVRSFPDMAHTARVYALSGLSGAVRWTAALALDDGHTTATPTVGGDGNVYVGSGYLFRALDGATGEELWSFKAAQYFVEQASIGADGTIYAPNQGGQLIAFGP